MIYIEDDEDVPLPKIYHRLNNICAIVYEQLSDVLFDDNYKAFIHSEFKFHGKYLFEKELSEGSIHILDWLKENDLNDEITLVLTKQLTVFVLKDILNFLYESISCAQRGKITVAYALLRKPLTDELLILEQLLYDPQEFIKRFFNSGEPAGYDPSKESNKETIIKNVLTKIKPNQIFTKDLVYRLRYNKEAPGGINGMSNKALHIVTADKNYKTENQSLNFVFQTEGTTNDFWNHYYYFVPYLLIYCASVVDNIVFKHLPGKQGENLHAIKAFRRIIGMYFWSEWTDQNKGNGDKKLFEKLSKSIVFDCPKCKNSVVFTKPDFDLFLEYQIFLCPRCFENLLETSELLDMIKEIGVH